MVAEGVNGRSPWEDDDRCDQGNGAADDCPADGILDEIEFDGLHGGRRQRQLLQRQAGQRYHSSRTMRTTAAARQTITEPNGYCRFRSLTTITTAMDRPMARTRRTRSLSSQ